MEEGKIYRLKKEYPMCGCKKGEKQWFGPNNLVSPEKFPDYWEEVIEKDYEILEIKGKYGTISTFYKSLDKDLEHKTIFKVKRLSDGEIFTIGDKVTSDYSDQFTGNINKFEIKNNELIIHFAGFDSLKHIIKCKTPLFTTEDGVDIFEGDSYYHNNIKWEIHNCTKAGINSGNLINVKGYNYFSTKDKAEEYIIMNKPCLSLNEIYELTNDRTGLYNRSDLEEIVKNKLNIK